MTAVAIALFITILIYGAERRRSPLRDQPCGKCGRQIHWRSDIVGWVHKDTGKTWHPYSIDEWDDMWMNGGYTIAELEFPHAATRSLVEVDMTGGG